MSYLVHQLLENSAQQYPDKEAVVYKDNSVTYRELDAVSNQLAWTLRNNGIEKGDRGFAWFQRKYRKLVVRWERIPAYFNAFLHLGTIHIWINRILLESLPKVAKLKISEIGKRDRLLSRTQSTPDNKS